MVTVLSEALSLDALWSLLSRRRCISGVVLVATFFKGKTLGVDTKSSRSGGLEWEATDLAGWEEERLRRYSSLKRRLKSSLERR